MGSWPVHGLTGGGGEIKSPGAHGNRMNAIAAIVLFPQAPGGRIRALGYGETVRRGLNGPGLWHSDVIVNRAIPSTDCRKTETVRR